MRFISLRDQTLGDQSKTVLTPEWTAYPVPYLKVWELQKKLVEAVARGDAPNTVLFVEHSSVVTRGRGLQWKGETSTDERLRHTPSPESIEVIDIDRGGDLTWHGPGQFVAYPIFRLDGEEAPSRDVEAALRGIERVVMEVLKTYSIEGFVKRNAAGVWVKAPVDREEAELKIASLGIGVRKWTTFHGLALNVVNSLEAFSLFSPCGFSSEVMTSLRALSPDLGAYPTPAVLSRDEIELEFQGAFQRVFLAKTSAKSSISVQEIDACLESTR